MRLIKLGFYFISLFVLGSCSQLIEAKMSYIFEREENPYGIVLESKIEEIPKGEKTEKVCSLSIANFPEKVELWVFSRALGGDTRGIGKCFKNEEGKVLIDDDVETNIFSNIKIPQTNFFPGEPVTFYVVSLDNLTTCAKLEVTPNPNEAIAKDGAKIALVLCKPVGKEFKYIGEGFLPFEKLTFITETRRQKFIVNYETDGNGKIIATMSPDVSGFDGGKAKLTCARENNETLELEFFWGRALFDEIDRMMSQE